MKTITGQYECVHSSGVGLDYFTSRVDKLLLYPTGRFSLIIQTQSRAANAAKSLVKGQQVNINAPEMKREGTYKQNANTLELLFDDGGFEPCQISWNSDGLQIGPNFFKKVSDSTSLPPTHRMKQDMDDIAKGLKMASTIGGMAMKAAKTIQGTLGNKQDQQQGTPPTNNQAPYTPPSSQPAPSQAKAIFCEQCGAQSSPGKNFCNKCGARLNS